ncbi:MAG: YbaY family lipoprotein [Paraclostridium bifermentans]|uniref:pilus assembly FimT family protein n=1 Tax=Paraclostridium bifermentans TaxID=1490 RepID=UPI0011DCBC7A|nr:YbaY family lipoprotein [Paraclostridium bifermentans]MBS6507794.1 YbaY family lipoprotein [Paraclostridium bifermentans]MDU3802471.1 YbaY family lipoprotein [Paraclostridium bifermentans]
MTLVEVVIGIGIIMTILMISFPKEKSQKYEMDSFARQLVGDIRYVRSMNSNGNLSVFLENISTQDNPRYVIKENTDIVKTVYLPKNSSLSYPSSTIKFKSDGTLSSKGETIIIDSKDKKIKITIIPFSGRVLLKEDMYET